MKNFELKSVLEELKAAGVPYQIKGGNHLKILWQHNGQRRMVVVSRTPSDYHGAANSRALVRRLLRQDGLLEARRA